MRSAGAPACLPNTSGTCSLTSDITTFDGARQRLAESCNYVLAIVCTDSAPVPFFRVEARNEQRGDSYVSVQQVDVHLQGLTVSLLKREARKAMVSAAFLSHLTCPNTCIQLDDLQCSVVCHPQARTARTPTATQTVAEKGMACSGLLCLIERTVELSPSYRLNQNCHSKEN